MAVQLGGMDAAFLSLESSTGHLQAVGVVRLAQDAPHLGVAELREHVAARLPRLDVLHRRLVTVPGGVDRPYWVEEEPDLHRHIRGHRLPDEPGALERFCAGVAGTPVDRSRPLWELWLVDDPSAGDQVVVAKLHHSLCDGIGALALVAQLFDEEPAPPASERAEVVRSERAPGWPWLMGRAALHALRWPLEVVTTSVELVGSVLRLRDTVEHMSAADLAAPLATPHLPFDGPITAARSIALRDLPVDRVKALATASGTHVNDVMLAVLAGTLRRWLALHGELPERPLVAAVPVSTRRPEQLFDPGNHVSACFVHLPTNLEDPRERLSVTAAVATSGKALLAAVGTSALEHLTAVTYPIVLSVSADLYQRSGAAAHHPAPVNLVVSNVAGPTFDLFLAGRPATAFYALGPIFDGVTLNITGISFRNTFGFGYLACPDLLDDLDVLADGQADAFEELAAVYGV